MVTGFRGLYMEGWDGWGLRRGWARGGVGWKRGEEEEGGDNYGKFDGRINEGCVWMSLVWMMRIDIVLSEDSKRLTVKRYCLLKEGKRGGEMQFVQVRKFIDSVTSTV